MISLSKGEGIDGPCYKVCETENTLEIIGVFYILKLRDKDVFQLKAAVIEAPLMAMEEGEAHLKDILGYETNVVLRHQLIHILDVHLLHGTHHID